MMLTVYLAGPEVFLPDGREVLDAKRRVLEEYGLIPVSPPAELGSLESVEPSRRGAEISRRNEELVTQADACLANLTPFRGVSADVGTVYELGLAAGMGKWVAAYSNEHRSYRYRVEESEGSLQTGENGVRRTRAGLMVEDHGMVDNLMLDGGLLLRGAQLWVPQRPEEDLLRGTSAFRRAAADLAARAQSSGGVSPFQ